MNDFLFYIMLSVTPRADAPGADEGGDLGAILRVHVVQQLERLRALPVVGRRLDVQLPACEDALRAKQS